jgi:hypothetical protein
VIEATPGLRTMPDDPASNPAQHVGERLCKALTEKQRHTLLDVAAQAGALQGLDAALRAADTDLAETVRAVLAPGAPKPPECASSDCRAVEIWNGLWEKWQSHVAELGDEEGDYANHDEHWRPPEFDPYALADDLEKVAENMAGWMERAFPLVHQPDLFDEALAEISDGIESYPDWMAATEYSFALGPKATGCVLRWIWLGLQSEPDSGPRLVDRLMRIEERCPHVGLAPDDVVQFLCNRPEAACRSIHDHLRTAVLSEATEDICSVWHRVLHVLDERFDPAAHLRTCEENAWRDWRYGRPLLADALTRSDFVAAERFVVLTISSLLGESSDDAGLPEARLLPGREFHLPPEEGTALVGFLETWERIAVESGNGARGATCRLQKAVLQSSDDWPVVLAAFERYRGQGGQADVAERLFAEWRERMVKACAGFAELIVNPGDSWVFHLIDACHGPAAAKTGFLEHADVFVECSCSHGAYFAKRWRSLALLTRSLPDIETLAARCPTFCAHVLTPAAQLPERLEWSVRNAFASLGSEVGRLSPMPAWEKHLHTLVPSPDGAGGSYYRESALWMKALSEVNRSAYDTLLTRWRKDFRRRRNLWADMAACGCPGC